MFMFNKTLRLSVIAVAVAATSASAAPQPQAPAAVAGAQEALAPLKARYAPDRRLAVFDVSVQRTDAGVTATGEVEQVEARDAVTRALEAAGLGPVINTVTVLPDPALGAKRFGIVRVSVANVRGRAAHSAEMVTQTVMGWTARVLKQQSGWYYVHTEPDGYLGWIEELQLTVVDDQALAAWNAGPRVVVTAPYTVIAEQPHTSAFPVTDAVAGAIVRAAGREGDWTAVSLADGRRGFVPSAHVEDFDAWKTSRHPTPDNIERTARAFLGVPYLWGGTSSKGLDCSGYTKTVFRLNGIELPRDTDQQATQGTEVATDAGMTQLRKGDLLFFGTAATAERPERISHVAVYVGNGEFLHASGLVRRNSLLASSPLFSDSLRARLLHVRRVLP